MSAFNGKNSDWLTITQQAFRDGRNYFDAGIRREIERDVRQFQGQHAHDSKYLTDAYRARSKFFRPKTRGVIRKNEAVAAAAFFSNTDVVEITPWDDSSNLQRASASMLKEMLNLRLRRTIPWFQTSIGAYQEAMVAGQVAAHVYWKTDAKKQIDEPCIDLIPIENLVISPSSSWVDPINTSPYLIHMIPMCVKDVQARMKGDVNGDEKPRWKKLEDAQILSAVRGYSDSIRLAREHGRPDSQSQSATLTPYQLVWVYKCIADVDGVDYSWYTLADVGLLSDGIPLSKVCWHGLRPYVIGECVVEAHKIYKPGVARLTREMQSELNENVNQRSDNVKFAMNKRYWVKRGANVDIRALTRNVPSGVTFMNKPNGTDADAYVVETKDVTQSAYEEQDRIEQGFDEIAGSFTPGANADRNDLSNKVGGAELLTDDKHLLQGYQLRTFTETFIEPVLYQLMRLEQHYETDEDILQLCAQKADIAEHGINSVDGPLLMQELALAVHVGIGATSPRQQLDNFIFALHSIKELCEGGALQQIGLDLEEFINEIFGKLGYKSGERFFRWDEQDPNVLALQNQVQQLQQELSNKKDPPEIVAQKVELLKAQVKKTLADAFNVNVEGLFGSTQAAEVIAAVPAVAPVADTLAKAAGYEVPNPPGVDPSIQQGSPAATDPQSASAQSGAAPAGDAAAAGAASGLQVQPVQNHRTGVQFTPGGGTAQPALPPGMPHNTHPTFPAHADVGAHKGIEGGK
jgi:hypothetical protein